MSDYIQEQGAAASSNSRREERKIIFASSLGTVFEWYDFFLYGALAAVISKQFFAGVNDTTAFIFALMAFAAGFLPWLAAFDRQMYFFYATALVPFTAVLLALALGNLANKGGPVTWSWVNKVAGFEMRWGQLAAAPQPLAS